MSSRSNTTEPPFHFKAARGSHIWDEQGTRYTDLTSGWNVVNAGWNCPEIRDDWHRYIDTLTYRPAWCTDDFYKRLEAAFADFAPGYVMIPSCSGGEGIDNALKIARLVTGRPGVISIAGSYHGSNTGAALAAGHDVSHLEILDLERHRVVIPVPGGIYDLPEIERQIRQAEGAAAIVFETVLTNAGCHMVPAEFLSLISRLAAELGILLICDEIGTGLNRTGSLLSCQRRGIRPDIIVCGKALTNGLYPLSLCLASADLTRFSITRYLPPPSPEHRPARPPRWQPCAITPTKSSGHGRSRPRPNSASVCWTTWPGSSSLQACMAMDWKSRCIWIGCTGIPRACHLIASDAICDRMAFLQLSRPATVI
jgi:4-aminobutyrate aminotransferase-like enzyme